MDKVADCLSPVGVETNDQTRRQARREGLQGKQAVSKAAAQTAWFRLQIQSPKWPWGLLRLLTRVGLQGFSRDFLRPLVFSINPSFIPHTERTDKSTFQWCFEPETWFILSSGSSVQNIPDSRGRFFSLTFPFSFQRDDRFQHSREHFPSHKNTLV